MSLYHDEQFSRKNATSSESRCDLHFKKTLSSMAPLPTSPITVFLLTWEGLTASVILQIYPGAAFLILLSYLKLEKKLKLKFLNMIKRLTRSLLVSSNLKLTPGLLLKKNTRFRQKQSEKLSALQITVSSLSLKKALKALFMFLKCHGPKRPNIHPNLWVLETQLKSLS